MSGQSRDASFTQTSGAMSRCANDAWQDSRLTERQDQTQCCSTTGTQNSEIRSTNKNDEQRMDDDSSRDTAGLEQDAVLTELVTQSVHTEEFSKTRFARMHCDDDNPLGMRVPVRSFHRAYSEPCSVSHRARARSFDRCHPCSEMHKATTDLHQRRDRVNSCFGERYRCVSLRDPSGEILGDDDYYASTTETALKGSSRDNNNNSNNAIDTANKAIDKPVLAQLSRRTAATSDNTVNLPPLPTRFDTSPVANGPDRRGSDGKQTSVNGRTHAIYQTERSVTESDGSVADVDISRAVLGKHVSSLGAYCSRTPSILVSNNTERSVDRDHCCDACGTATSKSPISENSMSNLSPLFRLAVVSPPAVCSLPRLDGATTQANHPDTYDRYLSTSNSLPSEVTDSSSSTHSSSQELPRLSSQSLLTCSRQFTHSSEIPALPIRSARHNPYKGDHANKHSNHLPTMITTPVTITTTTTTTNQNTKNDCNTDTYRYIFSASHLPLLGLPHDHKASTNNSTTQSAPAAAAVLSPISPPRDEVMRRKAVNPVIAPMCASLLTSRRSEPPTPTFVLQSPSFTSARNALARRRDRRLCLTSKITSPMQRKQPPLPPLLPQQQLAFDGTAPSVPPVASVHAVESLSLLATPVRIGARDGNTCPCEVHNTSTHTPMTHHSMDCDHCRANDCKYSCDIKRVRTGDYDSSGGCPVHASAQRVSTDENTPPGNKSRTGAHKPDEADKMKESLLAKLSAPEQHNKQQQPLWHEDFLREEDDAFCRTKDAQDKDETEVSAVQISTPSFYSSSSSSSSASKKNSASTSHNSTIHSPVVYDSYPPPPCSSRPLWQNEADSTSIADVHTEQENTPASAHPHCHVAKMMPMGSRPHLGARGVSITDAQDEIECSMYSDLFCRDLYGETQSHRARSNHIRHASLSTLSSSLPNTPCFAIPCITKAFGCIPDADPDNSSHRHSQHNNKHDSTSDHHDRGRRRGHGAQKSNEEKRNHSVCFCVGNTLHRSRSAFNSFVLSSCTQARNCRRDCCHSNTSTTTGDDKRSIHYSSSSSGNHNNNSANSFCSNCSYASYVNDMNDSDAGENDFLLRGVADSPLRMCSDTCAYGLSVAQCRLSCTRDTPVRALDANTSDELATPPPQHTSDNSKNTDSESVVKSIALDAVATVNECDADNFVHTNEVNTNPGNNDSGGSAMPDDMNTASFAAAPGEGEHKLAQCKARRRTRSAHDLHKRNDTAGRKATCSETDEVDNNEYRYRGQEDGPHFTRLDMQHTLAHVSLRWTRKQLCTLGVPYLEDVHRYTGRAKRVRQTLYKKSCADFYTSSCSSRPSCDSAKDEKNSSESCRNSQNQIKTRNSRSQADVLSGCDVILQLARRYKNARTVFVYVCMNVLLRYSVLARYGFDLHALLRFVRALAELTRTGNPFHHALYAAEVVFAAHEWLCAGRTASCFTDEELLAFLIAAATVNVSHVGVDNVTLCRLRHPFAMMCDYARPQQSAALSIVLALLLRNTDTRFLPEPEPASSLRIPSSTTAGEPARSSVSSLCFSSSVSFFPRMQPKRGSTHVPSFFAVWTDEVEWYLLDLMSTLILVTDPRQHRSIRRALRDIGQRNGEMHDCYDTDVHCNKHEKSLVEISASYVGSATAAVAQTTEALPRHDILQQPRPQQIDKKQEQQPRQRPSYSAHKPICLDDADAITLLQGILHISQACYLFRSYACCQAYACMAAAEIHRQSELAACHGTTTPSVCSIRTQICDDATQSDWMTSARNNHSISHDHTLLHSTPSPAKKHRTMTGECARSTTSRLCCCSLNGSGRDIILLMHRDLHGPLLTELTPYLPAKWLRQARRNGAQLAQRCTCAAYVNRVMDAILYHGASSRESVDTVHGNAASSESSAHDLDKREGSATRCGDDEALCEAVQTSLLRSCTPIDPHWRANSHNDDAVAMRVILSHAYAH